MPAKKKRRPPAKDVHIGLPGDSSLHQERKPHTDSVLKLRLKGRSAAQIVRELGRRGIKASETEIVLDLQSLKILAEDKVLERLNSIREEISGEPSLYYSRLVEALSRKGIDSREKIARFEKALSLYDRELFRALIRDREADRGKLAEELSVRQEIIKKRFRRIIGRINSSRPLAKRI